MNLKKNWKGICE